MENWVRLARNNGRWDQPGLTSSLAKADTYHTLATLVQPDGSILVQYALYGDVNLDGVINLNDYLVMDSNYLAQIPDADLTYAQGDLNYDDVINLNDYFLIDSAYLGQPSGLGLGADAVPEPSILLLLIPGVMRRRRG